MQKVNETYHVFVTYRSCPEWSFCNKIL